MKKWRIPSFCDIRITIAPKVEDRGACKNLSAPNELEKQIDEYLAPIQISRRFKDWALKYLHELHEKESAARNDIIQAQQKAYQECVRRIDNLVKLKTSPNNADGSHLSDDEYARQRSDSSEKRQPWRNCLMMPGIEWSNG